MDDSHEHQPIAAFPQGSVAEAEPPSLDGEPEPAEEIAETRLTGTSLLDQLRARRAALAAETSRTLDLDVPGYDGRLVARYHYPEAGYRPIVAAAQRAQQAIARKGGAKGTEELDASCDVLLACCESVLGRNEAGALVDLESDREMPVDGPGLKFGPKLAGLLGIEVDGGVRSPNRYVLRNVFSPRAVTTGLYEGDLALMAQSGAVVTWLQAQDAEVSEEFVGE